MKKIVLSLALVGLLGAGVYISRAMGFTDIAGILDAQAKTYTAEYQAVKETPVAE